MERERREKSYGPLPERGGERPAQLNCVTKTPEPPKPVPAALVHLTESIVRQDNLLSELETRLDPVLQGGDLSGCNPALGQDQERGLVGQLGNFINQVDANNRRLCELMENLTI